MKTLIKIFGYILCGMCLLIGAFGYHFGFQEEEEEEQEKETQNI